MSRKCVIQEGNQVVAKKDVLACPSKVQQLKNRTGLSEEELLENLRVVAVKDEHLYVQHPYQPAPVPVHFKFFELA